MPDGQNLYPGKYPRFANLLDMFSESVSKVGILYTEDVEDDYESPRNEAAFLCIFSFVLTYIVTTTVEPEPMHKEVPHVFAAFSTWWFHYMESGIKRLLKLSQAQIKSLMVSLFCLKYLVVQRLSCTDEVPGATHLLDMINAIMERYQCEETLGGLLEFILPEQNSIAGGGAEKKRFSIIYKIVCIVIEIDDLLSL